MATCDVYWRPDFVQGGTTWQMELVAHPAGARAQRHKVRITVADTIAPPEPEVVARRPSLGADGSVLGTAWHLRQRSDKFLDSPAFAGTVYDAIVDVPIGPPPVDGWPVRLYLHGFSGALRSGARNDEIVVRPHDPRNTYWYGYHEEAGPARDGAPPLKSGHVLPYTARRAIHLLDWVHRQIPGADPERTYIAGHSMGGAGAKVIGLLYSRHFTAVESYVGQAIARNHRSSRKRQLATHWGAPARDLTDGDGLAVWDRLDMTRALADEPGAADLFVLSYHAKDDPIIHFGAAVFPSGLTRESWLGALHNHRVAHVAYWDEGGHAKPDPILGDQWWGDEHPVRGPRAFVRRDRPLVAFTNVSTDSDPGSGGKPGAKMDSSRGFAANIDVVGDTGWNGDRAGAIGAHVRFDPDRTRDGVDRFETQVWADSAPSATRHVCARARPRAIPAESSSGATLSVGPARTAPDPLTQKLCAGGHRGPWPIAADITPRNTRAFTLWPGETVTWRIADQSGTAQADRDGRLTIEGAQLSAEPQVLVIERRPQRMRSQRPAE